MNIKKLGIVSLFALCALGGIGGVMLVGYIIIVHGG
ncbi:MULTISPECIES: membrane protein [Dickeya]|nr:MULTISPECIES: membrane protein [Dickeya]AIR68340.1 membrane protein [Dickeya fangzhongdai]KGT99753.1 membrane protein [Dickeya fangzhongdai]KHN51757.1 membrane protein [Dickeya fangzhongdai]WKV51430.1 hypothetical protein PL145_03990 [Dickeya fangzhongdai]WPD76459.1 hypothetical protein OGM23_03605 [Dickeya fangzhongdai]